MAERGRIKVVPLSDTKPDDLLSVDEVAELLGCTHGRVCQLLRTGELRGEKFRNIVWQIKRSDAEKFVREPGTPGRPRIGKNRKK